MNRKKIQAYFIFKFFTAMSKHHIPPKERNNTFPQAKKALKNANDDVKEIMNNGILF
jgi:hypothetical protein